MMNKLENEVLLSRRAALGAFATVALGTAGLLAGCGSDKATVTEDADDGDKKEETKKEEQPTTDLAVGTTVTTAAGLSVVVDSVQPGLTNFDGSTMTGIHVTYVNNGDEGADYNVYDWKGEDANGAQQNQGYYSEGPMNCSLVPLPPAVPWRAISTLMVTSRRLSILPTCLISLLLQAGCWPNMSLPLRRMGGEVVCPIKS